MYRSKVEKETKDMIDFFNGAIRPTWRERQIIWERIRFICEADKKSIGRDYHVGNMLDAYRKWEGNFFGGCEKEGA